MENEIEKSIPVIDDYGNKLYGFSLRDIEEYNKQLQETAKKIDENTKQLQTNIKQTQKNNKIQMAWMIIISLIIILIIYFIYWLHSNNFLYYLIKNIKTINCK